MHYYILHIYCYLHSIGPQLIQLPKLMSLQGLFGFGLPCLHAEDQTSSSH